MALIEQHGSLFVGRLAQLAGLPLDDVLVRVYNSDRLLCHNLGGLGANLVEIVKAVDEA